MIPSLDKPKYKPLIRLRIDVWNNLQKKKWKKKKWTFLISILKRQTERLKGKIPKVRNYYKREVPKFPVYARYRYQKNLALRLQIRFMYGRLQHYKIKKIATNSFKKSWVNYIQKLEQSVSSFLYRTHLVITFGEAKIHQKHHRIYVSGNSKEKYLKKGDILHFQPDFENLLKRRFLKHYIHKKQNLTPIKQDRKTKFRQKKNDRKFYFGIHNCIDFDPNSFRFFFFDNIKHFKNHPFRVPFEKIIRWYTKV